MKRFVILAIVFFAWGQCGAATITRYVDPDAAGAGTGLDWTNAYSSLTVWEAANNQDLTDAGGDNMVVYCRSSGGHNDPGGCTISGWTTGDGMEITIIGSDFPSDGVYDESKFVVDSNVAVTQAIYINEAYVNLVNLQICATVTTTQYGVLFASTDTACDQRMDSCIIKGVCSGTGSGYGIRIADTQSIVTIYNTTIYNFVSGADTGFQGIREELCASVGIYNCTVYNNYRGILSSTAGTMTVKNCAVGNNVDDFFGTITMDYIVADDDHSGNCATYFAFPTKGTGDWSLDFTTPGSNFTLLSTAANLINHGLADVFAEDDDIIGTARPQGAAWDIGAYEYESGAPPAGANKGYYRRRM